MNGFRTLRNIWVQILFHRFLLEDKPGITTSDPNAADLFFVPFYASSSMRIKAMIKAKLYDQLKSWLKEYGPYWNRYANVTLCQHQFHRALPLGVHDSFWTAARFDYIASLQWIQIHAVIPVSA